MQFQGDRGPRPSLLEPHEQALLRQSPARAKAGRPGFRPPPPTRPAYRTIRFTRAERPTRRAAGGRHEHRFRARPPRSGRSRAKPEGQSVESAKCSPTHPYTEARKFGIPIGLKHKHRREFPERAAVRTDPRSFRPLGPEAASCGPADFRPRRWRRGKGPALPGAGGDFRGLEVFGWDWTSRALVARGSRQGDLGASYRGAPPY